MDVRFCAACGVKRTWIGGLFYAAKVPVDRYAQGGSSLSASARVGSSQKDVLHFRPGST